MPPAAPATGWTISWGCMDTLGIAKAHVVGHSMGGTLVFNLIAAAPGRVLSGTVVNPGSPYGFGGSKGVDGVPCYDDCAGSGGGVVNPDFPKLDRGPRPLQ